MIKRVIFLLGLAVIFFNSAFQLIEEETEIQNILNKIGAQYQTHTKKSTFRLTSSYRWACTDSLLQNTVLEYYVLNGEYYINSGNAEFVINDDFFIAVYHDRKQLVYSNEALLDFQFQKDDNFIQNIRELVVNNTVAARVESINDREYLMTLSFNDQITQDYDKVELRYTTDYDLLSVKYFEKYPNGENLIQNPNCLTLDIDNEPDFSLNDIPKSKFNSGTYITKVRGKVMPREKYAEYTFIDQSTNHE
jgi:hypothetical protein